MGDYLDSLPSAGPQGSREWETFPWQHFRGYTKSQRAGKLKSWIWRFGFDIEHQDNGDNRLWFFELDANDGKEQALINTLKNHFDKNVFQSLLLAWITESNVAFRAIEAPRFRSLLDYLNPSIGLTQSHDSHDHSVQAFRRSHTGENIASQVAEVITSFEIQDKIGYFTLDNAENNDTAMRALDDEVFDSEDRTNILDLAQHNLWRKKGPIGKLHNLVHWIHRSDRLTYLLRSLQEKKDGTKRPVDVVTDNMTRWLSHYKMMDRALLLREFLDDLVAIEHNFRDVLRHFANALKALEGDAQVRVRKDGKLIAYGTAWDIIQAFEYLLEKLEEAKTMARDLPDSGHFAINYWKLKEATYPRLARMAFDMLSVPPMSAECERAFSFAGLMVTRLRRRLEVKTISAAQSIRSWLNAGLIHNYQESLIHR
ncbi:hypothetical protein HRG_012061 [Hirsutella rhossiliensis]